MEQGRGKVLVRNKGEGKERMGHEVVEMGG